MTPYPFLDDLGVVMLGAAAMVLAGRVLRLPPILAYMIGGLLLGPVGGILAPSDSLHLFSELGVALLLFIVGLELSVAKLGQMGGTALAAGVAQVLLTALTGAALARALDFDRGAALITGLVVAFSSTAVVIKLLDRTGRMDREDGRLAIGILLVQDFLVVVALTVLGGWDPSVGAGGLGPHLRGLGVSLLGMAGIVVVGSAAGRWVLPRLARWLLPTPEGFFVVGLTWAFGFIIAAETLHLSVELGAFVAGVILAQVPHTEELRRRTHPLVDFFLAVFFVSLGAGIDTAAMAATWPAALVVSVLVIVGKPILITAILRALGRPFRPAFLTGLTLGQISEFAFILAGLAAGIGLVGPDYLGFVGLVGILSMGVSAVAVPPGDALADRLEALSLPEPVRGPAAPPESPVPVRRGHVVVVGMNTLGRLLVSRFHELGVRVVAVDTDAAKLDGLEAETLVGDMTHRSVFEEAGAPGAALVVSTLQIEDVNSLLTFRCRRAGVPVSIHAFDPSLAEELLEIGASHLMVSKHDGIRQVEEALHRVGVLG